MTDKKDTRLPEGVNLAAMLREYDKVQAGMTPEKKKEMNQKVASGEQDFTISAVEATKARAAQRLMAQQGITIEEAEKHIQTLLDSGLDFMVMELGKDETKKEK